jgi:hypothetical protein
MTTSEGVTGAVPPTAVLQEVGALRRRTRADRHAYWFPLVLFGVLTVAALPLYVERLRCDSSGLCFSGGGPGQRALFAMGGLVLGMDALVGWYWLVALLVGGLATVWWYRWRAGRRGVQGRVGVALLVGLVTLGALLGGTMGWLLPAATATASLHGTSAFLVIAVGFLGLAGLERSRWLAVVAVCYAVAAGLAVFYDLENVASRVGWDAYDTRYRYWPNVLVPALVLLLGGGVAALTAARRRA